RAAAWVSPLMIRKLSAGSMAFRSRSRVSMKSRTCDWVCEIATDVLAVRAVSPKMFETMAIATISTASETIISISENAPRSGRGALRRAARRSGLNGRRLTRLVLRQTDDLADDLHDRLAILVQRLAVAGALLEHRRNDPERALAAQVDHAPGPAGERRGQADPRIKAVVLDDDGRLVG